MNWKRPRDGHLTSADGRFQIIPIYRSTVRPSGYWLEDRHQKKGRAYVRHDCELVRDAKWLAEAIVRHEREDYEPGFIITADML